MLRESLILPNYLIYRISFPGSLKTLNLSVFITKFNMIYYVLFEVPLKNEGMICDTGNLVVPALSRHFDLSGILKIHDRSSCSC